MKRQSSHSEIDFTTGDCVDTMQQKLTYITERMRSIHNPYTGNKKKLVVNIFKTIEKYGCKFDSFLDLFSGSAAVSIAAKYLGKKVFSNDLMTFAYLHAVAFVKNNDKWLTENDMNYLLNNNPSGVEDLVRTHYKERFTQREAEILDRYRENICFLRFPGDKIIVALAFLQILHYVMDRCFLGGRLNKGQVLADLKHRMNHSKNKNHEKEMNFEMIPRYEFRMDVSPRDHHCFNEDAISLLRSGKVDGIDLGYIDPPYGKDQSDYFSMYQFFEHYVVGSKPSSDSHAKKFVSTSNYSAHFEELLDALSKIPVLVFSYNNSSWSNVDEIVGMIRRFRKTIDVEKVEYPYKYREHREPAKEYIIVAR